MAINIDSYFFFVPMFPNYITQSHFTLHSPITEIKLIWNQLETIIAVH